MDNQKVTVLIDGKKVEAVKGEALLGVCQRNGVDIPTLCHNDQVTPEGRCRMCVTEIRWEQGGRSRIVVSCLYPVDEGLIVDTRSEKVMLVRKTVLELLLARNPEAEGLPELAAEYGITKPRYPLDDEYGKCILCGLCVRTCREVVGVEALGYMSRGTAKKVGPAFMEPSPVCIGCGACAFVCPTGHIVMTEKGDERKIWGKTFELEKCGKCGKLYAPKFELEWMSKVTGVPYEKLAICPDCR
jgi:NADH dehydrogenase/NADH:ubiquinone oxidoreductase subunit G